MSVSYKRDVSGLVEKYTKEFPNVERKILRRLIRTENKIENPTELRKLDRNLKKAYEKKETTFSLPKSSNKELKKTKKGFGFANYFNKRAERKKLEEEERRLSACSNMDLIAKMHPDTMSDLKDVSDKVRKDIKEARKTRRKYLKK